MGEFLGEAPPIPGEGPFTIAAPSVSEVIKEKLLTFEEASKCLNTLGKDETGSRYAYLMITATDRKLTDVSVIVQFKHVLFLDLSGNYLTLKALESITKMPFLVLLKAERNRVEAASFSPMFYLQVLDLNQNQIKNTENINQPLLDCLEMNYNDIYETNFDSSRLEKLKQLEMRSNLLFEINGNYPVLLEKLYLAANKISHINAKDLGKLTSLEVLHLRNNSLQLLDGFSAGLANLKYLNLRDNKIGKFKEFKKLQCLPNLETLIVTGNPVAGTAIDPGEGGMMGEGGKVRDPVILPLLVLLPKLKRINKTVITVADRIEAEDLENDILDNLLEVESRVEESGRTSTTAVSDNFESDN